LIYTAGDLDAAETVLREGLGSSAEIPELERLIAEIPATNARRLAIQALSTGDRERYVGEMRSAISLSQYPARLYRELAEHLLSVARDPESADALLAEGLERIGEDAELLYTLGVLKAMRSEFEPAVALFERSLAADPSSLQARENLAGMLCQLGRLEEGAAQYREALKQREDPGTLLLLAQALLALGNPLDALSQAQRAIELLPDDPFPKEVAAECERRLSAESGEGANSKGR
jgi:tetratricopeptide (TPR) repeat protein